MQSTRTFSQYVKKFKNGKLTRVLTLVYQILPSDNRTNVYFSAVTWTRGSKASTSRIMAISQTTLNEAVAQANTDGVDISSTPHTNDNWNKQLALKWAKERMAKQPLVMAFRPLEKNERLGYYQYRRLERQLLSMIYVWGVSPKSRSFVGHDWVIDPKLTRDEQLCQTQFEESLAPRRNVQPLPSANNSTYVDVSNQRPECLTDVVFRFLDTWFGFSVPDFYNR